MPLSDTQLGCSERYATKIACGGHSYLFSRRDVRDEVFETLVRSRHGRDEAWSALVSGGEVAAALRALYIW